MAIQNINLKTKGLCGLLNSEAFQAEILLNEPAYLMFFERFYF